MKYIFVLNGIMKKIFMRKFLASFLILTLLFPVVEPVLAQAEANETVLQTESSIKENSPATVINRVVDAPEVKYTPIVAVLVEKNLYRNPEIKSRVSRYGEDIQKTLESQALIIPIDKNASPRDIFELLSNLYFGGKGADGLSQLTGMVIVGDLPIPVIQKGDVYLPTIFPYVDFVNPLYFWNEKEKQFIYEGDYEAKAEIWHGLIQSSFKDSKKATDQLIKFFDQNHEVHIGTEKFSKKVFSANFDKQQTVIVDELFYRYTQWMKYVEPIQYLRFTKHFYRQLFIDEKADGISESFSDFPEDVQNDILESQKIIHPNYTREKLIESFDLQYDRTFPDLHAPKIIENLVKRYYQTYNHWFDNIFFEIIKAARWDSQDIETTPILVSKKDEDSVLRLRYFNDVLEDKFIELVKNHSVDSDVTVKNQQTVSYQFPWCAGISETHPLFWNGVNRQAQPLEFLPPAEDDPLQEEIPSAETRPFSVEDCSQARGSLRSEKNPFAQLVEGNKAFNFTAGVSCLPPDSPMSVRKDDKYEGSCIVNQEEKKEVLTYNYGATTSKWLVSPSLHRKVQEMFCNIEGGEISNEMRTKCFNIEEGMGELDCCVDCNDELDTGYCPFNLGDPECLAMINPIVHYGAERPVFDIAGTEEVFTTEDAKRIDYYQSEDEEGNYKFTSATQRPYNLLNSQGVEACRPLVTNDTWGDGGTTFSSLMIHNEPRPKTIMEQFKTQITRALPVDDPRGFSFWDHRRKFHRVDFLNIFKFRGLFSGEEEFKTAIISGIKTKIKEVNEISQTGGVATDLNFEEFESLLSGINFKKLFGAIDWLERNVEEKNRIVFQKAFSEIPEYQDYFIAPDARGYEIVDIRGKGSHENGLRMAFSPTDIEIDEEYFDTWQKVLDFEYEQENGSKNLFNGVDIADTFFAAQDQKDKCGSEPAGLVEWGKMLGCSAGVFTKGTTKKMYIKGLGTKNPSKAIIESFDVNLENKILKISPEEVYAYNQEVNLLEVVVRIEDKEGELIEEDFSTRVKLNFDSSDITKFYKISPAQEIPVSAGEAHFFLVPQAGKFGGKIKMQATAFRSDKPETKIKSKTVPMFIGRYGILGIANQRKMTVKDSEGTLIKAKILNGEGLLSFDMDGKVLEFTTDGGVFSGGVNSVKIREGKAQIRFLPGRKSGKYTILVKDPTKKIASGKIEIELEPDVPEVIALSKKSRYLVDSAKPLEVTAMLLDQYGNKVDNVFHQWTWKSENLLLSNAVEKDIDPRLDGIQEFSNSIGESTIEIQPKDGVKTARLSIYSDYFEDGRGRSFNFQVVKNPKIKLSLDRKKVRAGSEDEITVVARLELQNGEPFRENYEADLIVNPIREGEYPAKVQFKEGKAIFKFTPGTKAGIYDLFLIIPGFENAHEKFEVQADNAVKIELSRVGSVKYAAEIDKDKPIKILVEVMDKYKNIVPRFTEKINLRATKITRNLVNIPNASPKIENGKSILEVYSNGISGKLRLIAEYDRLVGDVMEIDLADFFRIEDVKKLTPHSLLSFVLGFEAGDMRDRENFANQFLFSGNTQAVGTIISDPEPQYQYANISPTGDIKGESDREFLFGNNPRFLITSSSEDLTENEIYFKRTPRVYISEPKNNLPGVYIQIDKPYLENIEKRKNKIYFDSDPMFAVTALGGIVPLDSSVEMIQTENIYIWAVEYNGDEIGKIIFSPEEKGLKTVNHLAYEDDFSGLKIKSITENIFFDRVFVGKSTRDTQGIGIFDKYNEASSNQKLGINAMSEQQALYQDNLVWDLDWKPGTFFAGGNSIGNSVKWGSSDGFILLGDPSIRIKDKNPPTAYGYTQDMGRNFWQIPDSSIQQIIVTDINSDNNKDILVLSENRIFAQYQTGEKRERFRDVGQILEFQDGVKSLATISTGDPKYPNNDHLVQVNSRSQLILWENKNGVFERKPLIVKTSAPIVQIKSARLNNDNFTDLIAVDKNRNVWALYSKGTDFYKPVKIFEVKPTFEETIETYEYGRSSHIYINTKFLQFGFKDITTLDSIDETIWNTYTRPGDGILTRNPEEIGQYIADSYYHPEKLTDFQNSFVTTEYASFIRKIVFSTRLKSGETKVKPGDVIKFKVEITPDIDLENFDFMPVYDDQYEYVEDSFKCSGCVAKPEILDWFRGDSLLWAEIPGISKRGKKMTFTWEQKMQNLPDLTFFVGDYDKKDKIDDISMPWFVDEENKLLQYLSYQNQGVDKRGVKKSPYKSIGKILEPEKLRSSFLDIKDKTQEELKKDADIIFGEKSDYDKDFLPYGFDAYPETHWDSIDKIKVLNGQIDAVQEVDENKTYSFIKSIFNKIILPVYAGTNPNSLNSNGRAPGHSNLLGKVGSDFGKGTELPWTHGGGQCFNQLESDVGTCLPGWENFRQRPDPFPCDADSFGGAATQKVKESPGKCIICQPNFRLYACKASTGKLIVATALGPKRVDGGKCVKNNERFFAKKYKPDKNTWVSTLPSKFMEVCDKKLQPKIAKASGNAKSQEINSFTTGFTGGSQASKNSRSQSAGKGIGFLGPLKPPNKTAAQLNTQYAHMNRAVTESMSRNAGGGQTPNPDFASQSASATGTPGGAVEQAQNDLNSSIFNMQRDPVPIQIPSTTPEQLEKDEAEFQENREKLEEDLDSKIPPKTREFKERLDKVLRALKYMQKLKTEHSELPSQIQLEGKFRVYEQDFLRFVDEIKSFCDKGEDEEVCDKSKVFAKTAQKRLTNAKQFLRKYYSRLDTLWKGIQDSIDEIFPKLPEMIEKLEVYTKSLEVILEARDRTLEHVTDFEKNFEALKDLMGEGAEQIIQLRDLENQVMAASAKMAEQYKDYHQGWMAEQQKRENQWASQQAANKQTLKSMQSVPDIYNKFADKCRTHNADKGTLFQNLTNEFVGPQKQPVTQLPENPTVSQDGRFQKPTKMDVKLPQAQITQVDYPQNNNLEVQPKIPDYAKPLEEGSKAIPISGSIENSLKSFDNQVKNWTSINDWLGESNRFFPSLKLNGEFTKPENSQILIPEIEEKLPKIVSLEILKSFQPDQIPDPIEEKEYEIPQVEPIPQLPKPKFQPQMPQMPMDQLPLTPPAPKMDNLTKKFMDNLKAPLKSINEECKVRLGATSVPEWYTKPHGERRTTRAALNHNKDYSPDTLKQQPFNDVAPVTQLMGLTEKVKDLFKGNEKEIQNIAELRQKALDQITTSTQEEIKKGLPRTIPWTSGQTIQANNIFMTQELQDWMDKMNRPVTEKISPEKLVKKIRKIAQKAPSTVSIHEDLKNLYAKFRLPKPEKNLKSRKLAAENFDKSIRLMAQATQEHWQDTQRLKVVFKNNPTGFFQNKLVQNILNKDKKYFAAGTPNKGLKDIDVNKGGKNFYQPENAYKKLQSYLVEYINRNKGEKAPGSGSGEGPNGTASQEVVDIGELIDPGIYYAPTGDDIPIRINRIPQYSDIVFTVADLDNDGSNEIIYADDDKIFIKRKQDTPGQKLRYNLESWSGDRYKDYFQPIKNIESFAQVNSAYIDFTPTENTGNYFSWELSERPDHIFEAYKKRNLRAANFQRKVGILTQKEPVLDLKIKIPARVIEVEGKPKMKSKIYAPVRFTNKASCRQPEVLKPEVESGSVMALYEPATFEIYHNSSYNQEGYFETINLAAGESMALEYKEICLYKGALWFTDPDEENFFGWNNLVKNDPIISGNILHLFDGDKLTIEFFDGSREYLEGPMEYRFQSVEKDEDISIILENIGQNQAYSILSGLKGNIKSGFQTQFLPITIK